MEHWYVYYKCRGQARSETVARALAMQAQLAASSGAAGRLVQSMELGDPITLMEIYERITEPERFAAALDASLARSGLDPEVIRARRVERFTDV